MRAWLAFAFAAGLAAAAQAVPLGSAFTYQGQLSDAGQPANGNYDLRFALYDAATGGSAIDTIDRPAVAIDGGLVETALDFTAVPFDGRALWVEVSLRASGGGGYTTLLPRQPLAAAPYALYALDGNPGPAGPPGAQGPAGPQGATGATGAQGPAGFVTLPYSGSSTQGVSLDIQNGASGGYAIVGRQTSNGGAGVYGESLNDGVGVQGNAPNGTGVVASSLNGTALHAQSAGGPGIVAISQTGHALVAEGTWTGVAASAIYAHGYTNGIAFFAEPTA